MEFPTKAERDYIRAIGIAAVLVVDGTTRTSRDIEASALALGQPIVEAWWCKDRDTAEALARAVDRKPGARIAPEAMRIGVSVVAHEVVMQRVRVTAGRIDDALRGANGRGELAWFNAAFKARRQQGSRVNFGTAWGRLRRAVVRRLVLEGRVEYGPDLLEDVFSIST